MRIEHLIHSLDPRTGGVFSAVDKLSIALREKGVDSVLVANPEQVSSSPQTMLVAHGLWQWPGVRALQIFQASGTPYLVYPHGMLDPWFKRTYPLKHIKKQLYWWWRQGRIMHNARAVCFTTEEELRLARGTFSPYQCRQKVTGLGVNEPPRDKEAQVSEFFARFPQLQGRRILLYLGRFHPKKGLDDLIRAWRSSHLRDGEVLVLAGPLDEKTSWLEKLQALAGGDSSIFWTGMLEAHLKWAALRAADALILPSHQENYGMVVAEACSVGRPVYLTNKVNLWREIKDSEAGKVEEDTFEGIQNLVGQWAAIPAHNLCENARRCFEQKLHISQAADSLLHILTENVNWKNERNGGI